MITKRLLKPISFILSLLLILLPFSTLVNSAYADDPGLAQAGRSANPNTVPVGGAAKPFVPGDAILIDTLPDTSLFLNQSFAIDDEGFVSLPIIGKVKIDNMSVSELEDYLKNQYKIYLRSSNLRVKPLIRVSLLGGFVRPGLYYVEFDNSLWEVVQLAGGTALETGLYKMRWERSRNEITDDLIPFIQNGVSLKRMGFHSGDQIYTPNIPPLRFDDYLTRYLPLLSFAVTITFFYLTYQQQYLLVQTSGR